MKDKKILTKLRGIAQKLPHLTTNEKKLFYGQTILDAQPYAKDGEGNPIEPTKYYHVSVPVPKNHYRVMKKLFEQGGRDKVNEYIAMCNDIVIGNQNLKKDIYGGLAERQKQFSI